MSDTPPVPPVPPVEGQVVVVPPPPPPPPPPPAVPEPHRPDPYAQAAPYTPPPPAYGQTGAAAPVYGYGPKTNTLSIVSLILSLGGLLFGILTSIPGIVCGHIALAQIRRTGEGGRGLALGGVIAGYVIAAFYLLILLVVIGVAVSTSRYNNF